MPDTFLLRDWQGFFQMTGAAAATLIGLIFLAISLGARLVPAEDNTALRAFVVPIVMHFGAVLVLSALMLIPAYTAVWLGFTLIGAGLVGLGYNLGVLRQLLLHHRQAETLNLHHWLWHWLIPTASYVLIAATGLGVLEGRNGFLPLLAVAALALIVVGLRNAFDLFLWIARQPV
jgi:hypothetical protein